MRSVPTRQQIEAKYIELIDGRITREAASEWASPWVAPYERVVENQAIFDALEGLYLADFPSTDREYLYMREDFEAWLADLRTSTDEGPAR